MNRDNFQHPAITLAVCLLVLALGWPAGACFLPAVFFLGREIAQAEYRWIEKFAGGLRANMPWWGGFDYRVWDAHSWWWNLLLPWAIAGAAFWLGLTYR